MADGEGSGDEHAGVDVVVLFAGGGECGVGGVDEVKDAGFGVGREDGVGGEVDAEDGAGEGFARQEVGGSAGGEEGVGLAVFVADGAQEFARCVVD